MNPIHFLLSLCISSAFLSCGGQGETASSVPSDSIQVKAEAPDTTSPESFIESVINFRSVSEQNTPGYEIKGNLLYEGSDGFKIFNFQESFDDYQLNVMFSIVLNGYTDQQDIQAGNDVFVSLPDWLHNHHIKASVFEGNFNLSYDFQKDASNDFILATEKNFRDRIISSQRILLFDGVSTLKDTEIKASSDYAQHDDVLDGQKEVFRFSENGKNPVTIILDHTQTGNLGAEGTNREIQYQALWQWKLIKDSPDEAFWQTGFSCEYETCAQQVEFFKTKRCKLNEEIEGYVMRENCQNGGFDFFQLVDHHHELTSCIRWDDNQDDVGNYYLVTIFQDATKYTLFFVRSEKTEANLTGYRDISDEFIPYYVTVYEEESGIEKHETADGFGSAIYTRNCDAYTLIPCID